MKNKVSNRKQLKGLTSMLLNEMEIFYHVVQSESFSQAAKRLKVSKSHISKSIVKLEQDLNTRLILRSTRKLYLTEAGENFFQYCVKVVESSEQGYAMIKELSGEPSGTLKISIPPAFGLNVLSEFFPQFLSHYPKITLDIRLESQLVNVIQEGYDVVLRSAVLESSNLIAQKIYTVNNIICATKGYVKAHGTPMHPQDLIQHNCAFYSDKKAAGKLILEKQKRTQIVNMQGNFTSNHLTLVKEFMLHNSCISILPEFMVLKELKSGQVIKCLSDYTLPSDTLYALYPEREFMLPRVSVFLKELKDFLKRYNV